MQFKDTQCGEVIYEVVSNIGTSKIIYTFYLFKEKLSTSMKDWIEYVENVALNHKISRKIQVWIHKLFGPIMGNWGIFLYRCVIASYEAIWKCNTQH